MDVNTILWKWIIDIPAYRTWNPSEEYIVIMKNKNKNKSVKIMLYWYFIYFFVILFTLTWNNLFFSQDQTLLYGCSRYTFYAASEKSFNFDKSRAACTFHGSDLVSIESNEEWNFLKDTVNKFPQNGTEYYIGLTKDKDGRWRWISNNSTVNESYWAKKEPSDKENVAKCAIMYKDFNQNYGLFNDLVCLFKRHGYICEREYHAMWFWLLKYSVIFLLSVVTV